MNARRGCEPVGIAASKCGTDAAAAAQASDDVAALSGAASAAANALGECLGECSRAQREKAELK